MCARVCRRRKLKDKGACDHRPDVLRSGAVAAQNMLITLTRDSLLWEIFRSEQEYVKVSSCELTADGFKGGGGL